jgi:Tol biopolymer transport system component
MRPFGKRRYLVPAVIVLACSKDSLAPTDSSARTGGLAVHVRLVGSGNDTDGFAITLGATTQTIAGNGTVRFENLEPGRYTVRVSSVERQCFVRSGTMDATVRAGATDTSEFVINCVGGIAYHQATGYYEWYIRYLNEQGRTIDLTSPGGASRIQGWSPDGSRLLFVRDVAGWSHSFTVRSDGTGLTQLTYGAVHDIAPRWSPDGGHIAFYSTLTRSGALDHSWITVIDADGTNERILIDSTHFDFDPAWSADGSRLYFSCDRFGKSWDLCSASIDGTGLKRIPLPAVDTLALTNCTPTACVSIGAGAQDWRVSPDGVSISFMTLMSPSNGPQAMWVAALDGSSMRVLTPGIAAYGSRWSPSGEQLLVSVARPLENLYSLTTVKRDLTEAREVGEYEKFDESGDWSPDGTLIAFDSRRSYNQQVWVMNADGTEKHQLSSFSDTVTFGPAWNPRARSNEVLPHLDRAQDVGAIVASRSAVPASSSGRVPLTGRCEITIGRAGARIDCPR